MAKIEQSIEVNVPLNAVYNQWTQFAEFPRFMEGVHEVRQLDDAHLHWMAERHGKQVEWDSEIVDQVPDHHIAWRDVSGPQHSGKIAFETTQPGCTRVSMTMEFDPGVAPPQSFDAERAVTARVGQDLMRFKKMMESQQGTSGAWRGEIHGAQSSGAMAQEPTQAAGKTVGQSDSERRETAGATEAVGAMGAMGAMGGIPGAGQGSGQGASAPQSSASGAPGSAQAGGQGGFGASGASSSASASSSSRSGFSSSSSHAGGASGPRFGSNDASRNGQQGWFPHLLQGLDDPMGVMRKVGEEFDNLLERFVGRPMASRTGQGGMAGKWMPAIEVSQRGESLVICADLPGVKREDVNIEVTHNRLAIEGERREEGVHMTPQGYRRSERTYGRFYRMIPLPDGVDPDAVNASMRDGVLEITVPVPPPEVRRGRKVDIKE